jgi:hypothetical protein
MADISGDLFDGLLFPSLHDTCEPYWLAASSCAAVDAAQQCPASSAASPCDKQHPLLRPCESEETTEDVFDSLDAFLAAEFPELDSECIPGLASPTHSSSYANSPASLAPPVAVVPALSCSSTDSHGVQLMQQQAFACSSPSSSGAPDNAESAAAAAAAAAAAKAQAQAFASLTNSPFSGMADSSLGRLGSTASTTTTISGAAAAATGTSTGSIPRWKLYHMQQRQELLAPKAASPKAPKPLQIIAGQGVAAAPAGSCGSPLSSMSAGAACLSPVNALASTATAGGMAAVAVPAQVVGAEQLLLLNLHQQQQLALQQQQCAVIVGTKRQWPEPVGAPITVLPCKAKRSRVTAAGNTAAQHMYGLTAEPCQQLQTLQVLQLQLQQQIQQNYQQQAEIYQQQQLQALHNQLHMRLQVQQHPMAFQPPVQTRHKRQATRVVKC